MGMSHWLGLNVRTKSYGGKVYGFRGKMGLVQSKLVHNMTARTLMSILLLAAETGQERSEPPCGATPIYRE